MAHTLKQKTVLLDKEKNKNSLFEKNIYRTMDVQDLSHEIQKNIQAWHDISKKESFHQMKLILGSEALRESGAKHIGFQIEIPSTVFGELTEVFQWSFDIEGNSDTGDLQERVYKKATLLKETQEEYVDTTFVRMHSLFGLEYEMKIIFNLLDKQLNYKDPDKALILTSLIFYELENLSAKRKCDYLLVDNMYDLSNPNDRWLACMNISAQYLKPSHNYMSHLMH